MTKQTENLAVDVAIIGAGACGLSLAFCLSQMAPDLQIAVFERELVAGKKLSRSGNGRCNLANTCWAPDFYHSLSWQNEQAYNDFWQSFLCASQVEPYAKITEFWQQVGVFFYAQENWLYPQHLSAKQLCEQLIERCLQNKVHLYFGQHLSSFEKLADNFQFYSVNEQGTYKVKSRYLVMAAGGFSQCDENAVQEIVDCLRAWRVPIVKSQPALVQLQTKPNYLRLTGLRLKVNAKLLLSDSTYIQERGEVLFTKYGISGIVSLILSNYYQQLKNHAYIAASRQMHLTEKEKQKLQKHLSSLQFIWPKQSIQQKTTYLLLDLLADISDEQIESFIKHNSFIKSEFRSPELFVEQRIVLHKKQIEFLLTALLPTKLKQIIIEQLELCCQKKFTLPLADLIYFLRNWPLAINNTLSFKEAQVSLGGVHLNAINPANFSLKSVKNCFIGGEMLDLVGDCGGYNLMLAVWTGCKIAETIKKSK